MTSITSVESTSLACPAEGVLVQTDCKGRLRVAKEQRKTVLARFEQSGMSATKFAAVAGIKYSTFAGWLQRYRRSKPRAASKGVRLVEAVIGAPPSQEPPSKSGLIMHLPGAVRLELSSAADVPLAAALIEALQKRGLGC
jgi:lambda repressor-like predicted transcriptional regulator